MLHAVELGEERALSVSWANPHRLLQENGAVIHVLIDDVHRHPGHVHPPGQGIPDRMGPGERWQEGRMDVEDPAAVTPDEDGREDPHEAREADEAHAVRLAEPDKGALKTSARRVGPWVDDARAHTGPAGPFERPGVGPVADDDRDARLQPPGPDGLKDRLEVRALPGAEDGKRLGTRRVPADGWSWGRRTVRGSLRVTSGRSRCAG